MKKVSICIPTYGKAEYVKQLLESIFRQTYLDYEIIITDDTVGNEVEQIVALYKDDRIKYYHNSEKLGHIFNWNRAIELATGEYIKIMFSDDWFTYNDSLEKYVKLLDENYNAGFAFSGSMQVSNTESYARMISTDFIKRLKKDYRTIFTGNEAGAPSGTIFRNNGIKFDEKSNWASDQELYLHLLSEFSDFSYSNEPLVSIGIHAGQYTNLFKERDQRIFNDYYYMFTKYNLIENFDCREFFEEMMLRYGKSIMFARKVGYKTLPYFNKKIKYVWKNKVLDYIDAGKRKINDIKKTK